MKPEQFRANAAGYLDGASTLIDTVTSTLRAGEGMKAAGGKPLVECPKAIHDELARAREILMRVSNWMLSEHNGALEKSGGAQLAGPSDV